VPSLAIRWTSASVSGVRVARISALTSGTDTALIDSSRIPRPTSTGAIIGSPAISPHTATGIPALWAARATWPSRRSSDGCSGS